MYTPPCVPASKAVTPSPDAEIRDLCDGSRPATDSGRDDHELLANAETPGDLRPGRPDSGPCAVDRDHCFRLVGPASSPLTDEQEHLFALVRLGWYWKEPGVLARPWKKSVPSFMNPEGK